MSANGPESKGSEAFDVVWMHGPTEDGEGTRVVRARPGRVDAGEVRPMVEGQPLAARQRSDPPRRRYRRAGRLRREGRVQDPRRGDRSASSSARP